MIQRIQSVYLLVAAILLFTMPFVGDLWYGTNTAQQATWFKIADLSIIGLGGAISLGAIFLYSNRKNQLKMVRVALLVAFLAWVVSGAVWMMFNDLMPMVTGSKGVDATVGVLLPLFSWLFIFLSLRAIRKDEALVRSMDRLRD